MNQMCLKLLTEVSNFLGNNFEISSNMNESLIERSKSISHIIGEEPSVIRKNINESLKNRCRAKSISNLNNSLVSKQKAFFTELSLKDLSW